MKKLFYNGGEFSTKKLWFNLYNLFFWTIIALKMFSVVEIDSMDLGILSGMITAAAGWYVAGKKIDGGLNGTEN